MAAIPTTTGESEDLHSILRALLHPQFYQEHIASQTLEAKTLQSFLAELAQNYGNELPQPLKSKLLLLGELKSALGLPSALCSQVLLDSQLPSHDLDDFIANHWERLNRDAATRPQAVSIFEIKPAAVISTLVARGHFDHVLSGSIRDIVISILGNLDKSLNLLRQPLPADSKALHGLSDRDKQDVMRFFTTIQRLCQVIIQPTDLPILLAVGFSSVETIAYCPLATLRNLLLSRGIDAQHAARIHSEAKRIQSADEHGHLALMSADPAQDLRKGEPALLFSTSSLTKDKNDTTSGSPPLGGNNMSAWFADLDDMGCPDCCSVTSPAAYFVDLLRFLKNIPAGTEPVPSVVSEKGKPPPRESVLAKLFVRRPELGDLLLSCRNTSDRIPYIDLVNEILESAIVYLNGKESIGPGLSLQSYNADSEEPVDHNLFSSSSTTAKKQIPRDSANVNYTLYDQVISKAVFPSSVFPYDQSADALDAYLAASDMHMSEILQSFATLPGAANSQEAHWKEAMYRRYAATVLNLTEEDFLALTEESFFTLDAARLLTGRKTLSLEDYQLKAGLKPSWYYWGYEDTDSVDGAMEMLQNDEDLEDGVEETGLTFIKKQLLPRLGESFATLVSLLKTRFMAKSLVIQPWKSSASSGQQVSSQLGDFRLRSGDGGQLDTFSLQRLEHLVRLWRRLRQDGTKGQKEDGQSVPWSLEDVDDALCLFGTEALPPTGPRVVTAETIKKMAAVAEIARISKVQLGRILALFTKAATYLQQLPISRAISLKSEKSDDIISTSSKYLALLLGSLDLSYPDFVQMQADEQLSPESAITDDTVFLFYRLSGLAKLFGVPYAKLTSLLAVLADKDGDSVLSSPEGLLSLLKKWKRLSSQSWTSDALCMVANEKPADTQVEMEKAAMHLAKLLAVATKGPIDGILSSPLLDQALATTIQSIEAGLSLELTDILLDVPAYTATVPKADGKRVTSRDFFKEVVEGLSHRFATNRGEDFNDTILLFGQDTLLNIHATVTPGTEPPSGLEFGFRRTCPLTYTPASGTTPSQVRASIHIPAIEPFGMLAVSWPAEMQNIKLSFDAPQSKTGQSQGPPPPPPYVLPRSILAQVMEEFKRLETYAALANQYKISAAEAKILAPHLFHPTDHRLGLVDDLYCYASARNTLARPSKEAEFATLFDWFCTTPKRPLASTKEVTSRFVSGSLLSQPLMEKLLLGNAEVKLLSRADRLNFLYKLSEQSRILSAVGLKQNSVSLVFSVASPSPFWQKSAETSPRPHTALVHHLRAALMAREAYQALSSAQDRLRNNRRRALVQYLLQHPAVKAWGVEDEGGLFEFFLIDVQMSSTLETTRIQQAISTIQLFVHRCLLGREKDVDSRSIPQDRWSWMQRLSTWEANRRVFLYPESYIDPTLRDNKTEIFTSLVEEAAMQNSLDEKVVQKILRGYMYAADEVANLRIEAALYDPEMVDVQGRATESPNGEGVYHFFARTRNAPYAFFYRSMEHTRRGQSLPSPIWSPWAKVPIEIPSHDADADGIPLARPGAYIVPVVWQRRLMVFIPKIAVQTKIQKSAKSEGTFNTLEDKKTSSVQVANPASVSVDIKLAWTELVDGVFGAPKQSGATLNAPADSSGKPPAFDSFRFQALPTADTISVIVYQNNTEDKTPIGINKSLGQFVLQGTTLASIPANAMGFKPRLSDSKFPRTDFGSLTWSAATAAGGSVTRPSNSEVQSDAWPKLPLPGLAKGAASTTMTWTLNSKYGSDTGLVVDVISAASRGQEPWFLLSSTNVSVPMYNTLAESFRKALAADTGVEQIYRVLDKVDVSNPEHRHAFGKADSLTQCREDAAPHAIYNWEAGFHAVSLLIERLISLQQFDRALEYARLVFDATGSNQEAPSPPGNSDNWRPTWRFPPFRHAATRTHGTAGSVLSNLAPSSGAEITMESRILGWRRSPFRPHAVARNRPMAYMKRFVMKYIEALVAAGDVLFRQNSLELVPLAVQKYVEALHVFGPNPESTDTQRQENRRFKSYNQLAHIIDDFSNATVASRLSFPYYVPLAERGRNGQDDDLQGFPRTRYFGIQANKDFTKLRGLIDDRLYKIRNSLDINGNPRTLSLWDPPLNPMDLVRAVAATGGNVQAALQGDTGVLTPAVNGRVLPRKRFTLLLTKAFELCAELKASSASLLAAIEKKDGEALSVLRSRQDTALQRIMHEMKTHQKAEAELGLGQLEQQRRSAVHRLDYYAALTGDASPGLVPKPDEDFQEVEQVILQPVDKDLRLTRHEALELSFADSSSFFNSLAADMDQVASLLFMLPMPALNFQFMGVGGSQALPNLGQVDQMAAAWYRSRSTEASENSARASRIAQWTRQLQERRLQLNLAGIEVKSIDKQVEVQKARIAALEADLRAQQLSVDAAAQTLEFYKNKFTSEQLYSWMEAGTRATLYQTYLATMELARKVESVYAFERGPDAGNPGMSFSSSANSGPFIAPAGYWDNSRHGLQAGEQLWLALKQLELAYLAKDDNCATVNVAKNVSLRQLDPGALISFRELGDATFKLPELLFDLDFPGHYFRRIKSVAFTIHCIVGPYTSINCTATLLDHKYRCSSFVFPSGGYHEKTDGQDDRFVGQDVQLPITSVAISSGQQDAGVFDLDFNGDDYQPFEGAGAISTWRLRLPDTIKQFDYRTISDVVLHLRYTARDGGEQFRQAASNAAKSTINAAATARLTFSSLLDIRNDAPDAWFSLTIPTTATADRTMTMRSIIDRLPYYAKAAAEVKITGVTLYVAGPAEELRKTTFKIFEKREHQPEEEVRLKYAEKFGSGNLHKFTVGAADLAAEGINAAAVGGNLDLMKAGSWYISIESADGKAPSPTDIMLLAQYTLST